MRSGLFEAQPRGDADHFEVRHENDDDSSQCQQQATVHAVAVAHYNEAVNYQNVGRNDYLFQITFNNT